MIEVTPRAMAAIARAYHSLRECGRDEDAEELIASFREAPIALPVTPSEPPKRSRVRTDEDRTKDRERQARLRVSRSLSRDVTGVTNGVTSSVTFRDTSRDHACLPEREEKRKLSDSGEISAEIENSQNQEKPQLPSRIGATIGATNGATSSATLVRIVQPKPQVSGPALLWLVWCQLTQTRGRPGQRDQQRLIDAWDTAVAIGERRDLPPAEVFRRAAEAFLADDDVNAKRLPLAVLCTQLARWAMPGSAKRGPVHATKAEDFDASGDDFGHLDEVNHG